MRDWNKGDVIVSVGVAILLVAAILMLRSVSVAGSETVVDAINAELNVTELFLMSDDLAAYGPRCSFYASTRPIIAYAEYLAATHTESPSAAAMAAALGQMSSDAELGCLSEQ